MIQLTEGDKIKTGDLITHDSGRVFKVTRIHDDGFVTAETVISNEAQRHESWTRATEDAPTPGARVYMVDRQHPLMLSESPMWAVPAMRGSDEPFGVVLVAGAYKYLILANEGGLENIHKYEKEHGMSLTAVEDAREITSIHPQSLIDEICVMLTGKPKKNTKPAKTWRIWKLR